MSGGLAYEALNNVGHTQKRLIVVLNDNNMSISENVGAMSSYFSRLRTAPTYFRMKSDFEYLMRKIPTVGEHVLRAADRVKDSLKHLVVPGMLFEEMGFTYLGPIDGHNEPELQNVLNRAKMIDGPVLIHAITKKGKGYQPAEKNPDIFHGTGPFDVQTGLQKSKSLPLTYTNVFGETLLRIAKDNPDIVGITAAMPDGTGLDKLRDELPQRYFDVGIAEAHAVTFAAGMAAEGLHPVVAVYSTFLQRAYDQVLMDVCLQNLSVVFAVDRAGMVGEDGETHQGLFDISFFRPMPNMIIMAPKDENELQHMLFTATQISGPCAIRYPRGKGFGVPMDQQLYEIPIGKAELLRDGTDLVVIAAGPSAHWALQAADRLKEKNMKVSVINVRYLKPLDEDMLLEKIQETGRVLVVEENVEAGGLSESLSHLVVKNNLRDINMRFISIPDIFITHGTRDQLLNENGYSVEHMEKEIENMIEQKHIAKKRTSIHLIQ
jgi:1-deoxy-D-xylulose-5-phosphate synthase